MISVIDDDAFARHGTENLLTSLGFGVSTFVCAEEFLASGRLETTQCVITDWKMPGLTGLDLQQRLIEEGREVPIIFITAFLTESMRQQAIDAGAIGVLRKPYNEACLIACLNKALADSRRENRD
jgi:FixJ family two-component response regulator